MILSAETRTRPWSNLPYYEPAGVLRELRRLERSPLLASFPERVRRLRTDRLKKWREGRAAALFSYGVGFCVLGREVRFALFEDEDFDFITAWKESDTAHFCPVQVKDVVPEDLNRWHSIESVLGKLAGSKSPTDTIALVYVARAVHIDFSRLRIPDLAHRQLWFIGASSPNQNRWFLYGDVLSQPFRYDFVYPEP